MATTITAVLGRPTRLMQPLIWLLLLAGLGIAGYLSWLHWSGATTQCLGGGQCATVQASAYAKLLGVPVAYLGLGSYLILAGLVLLQRRGGVIAEAALLGQAMVGFIGVAFSGWLTYVELFVIHAICPWCVASAVVMTLLFALTATQLINAMRSTTA